jgi:hypothetical protein
MTAEDLLTRSLREVTEKTDYPSTPVETVVRRAGAVRARRRRTRALAAAAAVAAVAVPGAVWWNHSPGTSLQPTVSPSSSSSPTSSPSGPTALAELPFGHKPGIDYLDGATYVGMGGGNVTEPLLKKVTSVALTRGGLVVALRSTLPDDTIGDLQLLTDQGDQGPGCGANRFAISADRVETAYWVMDSCTTGSGGRLYSGVNNTMGESGPSYVATPASRVVQPIGFVSEGVVANLTMPNGAKEVWVYGPQGGRTQVPGLGSAGGADQSRGRVSGQAAGDPSTGMIVEDISKGGRVVGYYPNWILGQFSPDGNYVLGYAPGDGIGTDQYAVFDVGSGRRVTELDYHAFTWSLRQLSWDVDDTVLAVAADKDSRKDAIVRFDLHGHATLATAPKLSADPSFPVYRLATRP